MVDLIESSNASLGDRSNEGMGCAWKNGTLPGERRLTYGCFQPKIGGCKTPKMDGENNGKPYEQMDDLGVPLFLETPIFWEKRKIMDSKMMPVDRGIYSINSWEHILNSKFLLV